MSELGWVSFKRYSSNDEDYDILGTAVVFVDRDREEDGIVDYMVGIEGGSNEGHEIGEFSDLKEAEKVAKEYIIPLKERALKNYKKFNKLYSKKLRRGSSIVGYEDKDHISLWRLYHILEVDGSKVEYIDTVDDDDYLEDMVEEYYSRAEAADKKDYKLEHKNPNKKYGLDDLFIEFDGESYSVSMGDDEIDSFDTQEEAEELVEKYLRPLDKKGIDDYEERFFDWEEQNISDSELPKDGTNVVVQNDDAYRYEIFNLIHYKGNKIIYMETFRDEELALDGASQYIEKKYDIKLWDS